MRARAFVGRRLGIVLLSLAVQRQKDIGPDRPGGPDWLRARSAPRARMSGTPCGWRSSTTINSVQRLNVDISKADEITAALKPNPVVTSTNASFPVFSPSQLTWDNIANNQSFVESLSYLFERGGKREKRTLVAQDTTSVAARTATDSERQLIFQTRQAFINVLLAKSSLDLARDEPQELFDVVDINRQRVTAGDLAEGDFLKISLQKLQFEQDVSAAEVGLVQARANLRQLVGFDTVTEDFDVVGDLTYMKREASLDDLKQQALVSRPDLLAAQSSVRQARDAAVLEHKNATRDITGDVGYSHRPGQTDWRRHVDRPADSRSQPGQHRARRGRRAAGRRSGDRDAVRRPHGCRECVRRAADQREGRQPVPVRLPGSVAPVARHLQLRLSARRRQRCSTCSTRSAPIARRSWPTARRWPRT